MNKKRGLLLVAVLLILAFSVYGDPTSEAYVCCRTDMGSDDLFNMVLLSGCVGQDDTPYAGECVEKADDDEGDWDWDEECSDTCEENDDTNCKCSIPDDSYCESNIINSQGDFCKCGDDYYKVSEGGTCDTPRETCSVGDIGTRNCGDWILKGPARNGAIVSASLWDESTFFPEQYFPDMDYRGSGQDTYPVGDFVYETHIFVNDLEKINELYLEGHVDDVIDIRILDSDGGLIKQFEEQCGPHCEDENDREFNFAFGQAFSDTGWYKIHIVWEQDGGASQLEAVLYDVLGDPIQFNDPDSGIIAIDFEGEVVLEPDYSQAACIASDYEWMESENLDDERKCCADDAEDLGERVTEGIETWTCTQDGWKSEGGTVCQDEGGSVYTSEISVNVNDIYTENDFSDGCCGDDISYCSDDGYSSYESCVQEGGTWTIGGDVGNIAEDIQGRSHLCTGEDEFEAKNAGSELYSISPIQVKDYQIDAVSDGQTWIICDANSDNELNAPTNQKLSQWETLSSNVGKRLMCVTMADNNRIRQCGIISGNDPDLENGESVYMIDPDTNIDVNGGDIQIEEMTDWSDFNKIIFSAKGVGVELESVSVKEGTQNKDISIGNPVFEENGWQRYEVSLNIGDSVSRLTFNTKNIDGETPESFEVDDIHLFRQNAGTKYCAEDTPDKWVEDLDSSEGACNAQQTSSWAGSCCGDDTTSTNKEYFVSDEGGCWAGAFIDNGKTVGEVTGEEDDEKILSYGEEGEGEFFGCGIPVTQHSRISEGDFVSSQASYCDLKGNDVCIQGDEWVDLSDLTDTIFVDVGSEINNGQSIKDDLEFHESIFGSETQCCPGNSCWNGEKCVAQGSDVGEAICIRNMWGDAEELKSYNPDRSEFNYCPTGKCFWDESVDGIEDDAMEVDGLNGAIDGYCVSPGFYDKSYGDGYCMGDENNAYWTTRTAFVGASMKELAIEEGWTEYTLHCGPELNGEYVLFNADNTPPSSNGFCVLENDDSRFVGISTSEPVIKNVLSKIVSSASKGRCDSVTGGNEYVSCGEQEDTQVWFNPELNTIIFTKFNEGVSSSNWKTWQETFFDLISNPIESIMSILMGDVQSNIEFTSSEDLTRLLPVEHFDQLYYAKAGDKEIIGFAEDRFGTENDLFSVTYKNLCTDVCSMMPRGKYNTPEMQTLGPPCGVNMDGLGDWSFHVVNPEGGSDPAQNNFILLNEDWNYYTSEIRLDPSECTDPPKYVNVNLIEGDTRLDGTATFGAGTTWGVDSDEIHWYTSTNNPSYTSEPLPYDPITGEETPTGTEWEITFDDEYDDLGGNTIYVVAYVSEGEGDYLGYYSFVLSEAPYVENVVITPDSPTENDDLTVSYDYIGDTESGTTFKWEKKLDPPPPPDFFIPLPGQSFDTLPNSVTVVDGVYRACLTPSDGLLFGDEVCSEEVTVMEDTTTTTTTTTLSTSSTSISTTTTTLGEPYCLCGSGRLLQNFCLEGSTPVCVDDGNVCSCSGGP